MWTYVCECNVCMCPAYMSAMNVHVCECNSVYVSVCNVYMCVCIYECNICTCVSAICTCVPLCVGAMYCMCVFTSAQRSEDNMVSCFYHSPLYCLEMWSLTEPRARLATSKAQNPPPPPVSLSPRAAGMSDHAQLFIWLLGI